jgi:AcrR family transcriptional regulator
MLAYGLRYNYYIDIVESMKANSNMKTRGRPPQVSTAKIHAAALEIVVKSGAEAVTIARVCESLNVSPKTIYNHVSGIEAILDGVVSLVFEQLSLEIPRRAGWRTQAKAWVYGVRKYILASPNVAPLLGSRSGAAPGWLAEIGRLGAILEGAGFDDKNYGLATTVLMRLASTLAVGEHFSFMSEQANAIYAAVGTSAPEHREQLLRLAGSLPEEDRVFSLIVESSLDAIEALAPKRARRSR